MATKTIRIEETAYRRLAESRRAGESLSDAILRTVPQRLSIETLADVIRENLSEETLVQLDKTVTRRRRTPRSQRS